MLPADFKGVTHILSLPDALNPEIHSDIPVMVRNDGKVGYFAAFLPSMEDIQAINAGGAIFVQVVSRLPVMVQLFTIDNDGKSNQV